MKYYIKKLLKNLFQQLLSLFIKMVPKSYAVGGAVRHRLTKGVFLFFSIYLILLSASEAFALKIKNFKKSNRNYTQQSDGNSEFEYQVNKEQQLKEILNKYLEQCNYIYIDKSPKVVFDALLQEVNNKFSKSLTYKDLLSNKDHLYFATNDWPPYELKKFDECKENMFGALLEAIKNHIK